ncbi:MAG: D-alanyl-lipoteichoic acid biosynthesis protein DltB [Acutalibacteraceae bacterium]
MSITQYANFFSLYATLPLFIPAIILGLFGKPIKYYAAIISIPIFCLLMGFKSMQTLQFLVFMAFEMLLVYSYHYLHKKHKNKYIYYSVFTLSILPIIAVKACVYTSNFNFLGFLGISYVSFRIWQMIIEIHDDHIDKLLTWETLYFVTFFPTFSSGPIDRYKRFKEDLDKKISGKEYLREYLIVGIKKILIGITYKFAIANLINIYFINNAPSEKTFLNAIIYMYAYTMYLFFDFAGYSAFAIGTSYILGIKTPENFNKPFLAHDMKEFWDRWHISLSKWFGDYLFSRFVLNAIRSKKIKSRKVAVRCGYMLTMLVMGLWHGFYLFYIAYGIYQGSMLVLTDMYTKSKKYRNFKKSKYYNLVSRIVCFHIIAFGMLIFSGYLFNF